MWLIYDLFNKFSFFSSSLLPLVCMVHTSKLLSTISWWLDGMLTFLEWLTVLGPSCRSLEMRGILEWLKALGPSSRSLERRGILEWLMVLGFSGRFWRQGASGSGWVPLVGVWRSGLSLSGWLTSSSSGSPSQLVPPMAALAHANPHLCLVDKMLYQGHQSQQNYIQI